MLSAASNPTWPTCVDQNNVACSLGQMAFFTDDKGTLPKYGPSQLVEATLGATQVQKVVNDSLPIAFNATQADFDVSYVNVAYMAAAMGPYKNNQSGYVGSPLLISQFQPKLLAFQKKFNWPSFVDLGRHKAPDCKIAVDIGAACETERRQRANRSNSGAVWPSWPNNVWAPIQTIRTDWANYSSSCQHGPQGFTTFCDAILDVRDLFNANFKQYQALFAAGTCNGKPVTQTPDRMIAHVYGWGPWTEAAVELSGEAHGHRLFPDSQSARKHARLRG